MGKILLKIDLKAEELREKLNLKDGEPGKDGEDYILTEADKKEIAASIDVPVVEKVVEKTETIREIPIVTEQKTEFKIENPFELKGDEIVTKINELPTDDESYKIDAEHIKNLPEFRGGGGGSRFLKYLNDVNIPSPSNGQVLKYNSTTGFWEAGTDTSTAPAGSDTQVQYNDGGSFGGDVNFTWNKTTKVLSLGATSLDARLLVHAVKGDTSDGLLLEANDGTDIGLLGAGNTANVTWYGSHNFNAATQDTIAGFIGSGKTLSSLSTSTYPSLTELSYVKGVTSAIQTQLNAKESALTFSTGLTRATNTITNDLSTGVSGGQSAIGGTASGNNLTLKSTTNATKGKVIFGNAGTTAYDEVNDRFGVGTNAPSTKQHIYGSVAGGDVMSRIQNTNSSGRALYQTYNDQGDVWEFSSMGSTYSGSLFGVARARKAELITNTDAMIGTVGSNFLLLGANSSEVMRLTSGLDVGINISVPLYKLHVFSTSNFTQFAVSGAQAPGVNWITSSTNASARNWGAFINTVDLGDFCIHESTSYSGAPSSGNVRFRIKSGGLALFGTTSKFVVSPDYAGSGDLPAGSFMGGNGTNGSISFAPSSDSGTSGAKTVLAYFNGSAWKSALEYANTSAGALTSLYLQKGGGLTSLGQTNTPTAFADLAASTTASASLRIRSGSAPTSPNDGDIWFDGTDIKMRISGTTKTFTLT